MSYRELRLTALAEQSRQLELLSQLNDPQMYHWHPDWPPLRMNGEQRFEALHLGDVT